VDKNEVLRRSRDSKQDEGMEYAEIQAQRFGVVVFATVAGVVAIFCLIQQDVRSLCVVMGLVLTLAASISFGRFYWTSKKVHLVSLIVCAATAIVLLATFLLRSLR